VQIVAALLSQSTGRC